MSAAAPAARPARVLAQARFETGTLLRNGEQLLVALVLPCAVLLGLAMTSSPSLGPGRRIDLAVPGVLALCVISSAFTAQAIATGFDRRYGVLRLLGVSPLGRGGLLGAKGVAVLAVEALQLVVIGALGLALGWHPAWSGFLWGAVFAVVGPGPSSRSPCCWPASCAPRACSPSPTCCGWPCSSSGCRRPRQPAPGGPVAPGRRAALGCAR